MKHSVVSPEKWLAARKKLLIKEKKFVRLREDLAAERRALPWEAVQKTYQFDGTQGKESFLDLFAGKSQLVVYHFMFGPGWKEGCPHCSFWADHYDGMTVHLKNRDVSFVAISRAPWREIKPFKKRMGWQFKWMSSFQSDFNYDYHVSFPSEDVEKGILKYNYDSIRMKISDREGISVFCRDKKKIFHTYSTFARGIDMVNTTYQFLDLVPKGRDEHGRGQFWVRYHDRYKK